MSIIVNRKELEEFIYCLYVVTKCKIVIYDEKFNIICKYPDNECEFCAEVISTKNGRMQCDCSNISSFLQCKKDGKLCIYHCHTGLVEATAPIRIGNLTIGYLMIGQIFNNPDKEQFMKNLHEHCSWYGLDFNKVEKAFEKVNIITDEQIYAMSKILEAAAGYMCRSDLISLENKKIVARLNSYIDENYMRNFTSLDICKELSISRSYLYEISMKYLGMSIYKYIQVKRLSDAMRQLADTDNLIKEIANNVGIEDYNYFTKVFKKHTGLTPKQYRTEHRKENYELEKKD